MASTDPYAPTSAADAQAADAALQQTTRQALDLIGDSLETAKEQACKLWDDVRPQLDKVANYAKEEPTKSVLMAVVAGALIVTLVTASRRSKPPVDVAASKKWLRAFAADAAERARELAQDKADQAREAAEDAHGAARRSLREVAADAADQFKARKDDAVESAKAARDSAVESAKRAATQAYEGVSDRLQDLRGKADPLLEQIQPQLDNVAGYAKKNPLSALIVATAAGALLSRLAK
jgi:ElaB/YqjD/DUF883 family membrane-anchored ribosome-binding protein